VAGSGAARPYVGLVERLLTAYEAIAREDEPEDIHSRQHDEWDAHNEKEAMVRTRPTTKAGAVTLSTTHLEQEEAMAPGKSYRALLETLAEAIPHLA
jgi:hypothetical protein